MVPNGLTQIPHFSEKWKRRVEMFSTGVFFFVKISVFRNFNADKISQFLFKYLGTDKLLCTDPACQFKAMHLLKTLGAFSRKLFSRKLFITFIHDFYV